MGFKYVLGIEVLIFIVSENTYSSLFPIVSHRIVIIIYRLFSTNFSRVTSSATPKLPQNIVKWFNNSSAAMVLDC